MGAVRGAGDGKGERRGGGVGRVGCVGGVLSVCMAVVV